MNIIINTNLSQILLSLVTFTVFIGIIQWLLTRWIGARIEKSIEHEYSKKIEDYRFQHLQRQKAETISKLFSKWIKYRGKEENYLDKDKLIDFYEELNQMSLEISLWIKDDNTLKDIMDRLSLKGGSKQIRELTSDIRKLILNDQKDKFDPQDIILWPNSDIEERLFSDSEKINNLN